MGSRGFLRLDANRDPEACKDGILLLPLFPKGRRVPERGGSLFLSAPLSGSLPTRASRGEREAKDPTLILRFMESSPDAGSESFMRQNITVIFGSFLPPNSSYLLVRLRWLAEPLDRDGAVVPDERVERVTCERLT